MTHYRVTERLGLGTRVHRGVARSRDGVERVRAAEIPAIVGLDPALGAIVSRALACDADGRYQHASELADAVSHCAGDRGIEPGGLAPLVRATQLEVRRERGAAPVDPRTEDDVARMTSIRDDRPGRSRD